LRGARAGSDNSVMNFPIKKRINTVLLIDMKHGLYVQKWLQELSVQFEEGKLKMALKISAG